MEATKRDLIESKVSKPHDTQYIVVRVWSTGLLFPKPL